MKVCCKFLLACKDDDLPKIASSPGQLANFITKVDFHTHTP